MKSIKNVLAALAFVFAIGAAFASTSSSALLLGAKAWDTDEDECITGTVSNSCNTMNEGTVCTISGFNAIPSAESNCETSVNYLQLPL